MKTEIKKTKLISKSIMVSKIIILFISIIGLNPNGYSQNIPANCLESPSVHFTDAFKFLKENVQAQRTIVATVWEFNTTTMTLDASSIGNNMPNLARIGTINYKKLTLKEIAV